MVGRWSGERERGEGPLFSHIRATRREKPPTPTPTARPWPKGDHSRWAATPVASRRAARKRGRMFFCESESESESARQKSELCELTAQTPTRSLHSCLPCHAPEDTQHARTSLLSLPRSPPAYARRRPSPHASGRHPQLLLLLRADGQVSEGEGLLRPPAWPPANAPAGTGSKPTCLLSLLCGGLLSLGVCGRRVPNERGTRRIGGQHAAQFPPLSPLSPRPRPPHTAPSSPTRPAPAPVA